MRTSRLATAAAAAASALLLARPVVGGAREEDGDQQRRPLRRTRVAAATRPTNTSDTSDGGAPDHNNGPLVTLPLLPHRTVLDRRRRERRLGLLLTSNTGNDEGEGSEESTIYDVIPSGGYPQHRRSEAPVSDRHEILAMYQGFGTHYVDLWVGTPPQRQTVIVDTGSGVTAFPCSLCNDCGSERYHTDGVFVEAKSKTFRPATCDKCTLGPCGSLGQGDLDDVCLVTMRYEEGSTWKAYEGRDWCYPGGPHDEALEDDGKLREVEAAAAADGADPDLAESFRFPSAIRLSDHANGFIQDTACRWYNGNGECPHGVMGTDAHSWYYEETCL